MYEKSGSGRYTYNMMCNKNNIRGGSYYYYFLSVGFDNNLVVSPAFALFCRARAIDGEHVPSTNTVPRARESSNTRASSSSPKRKIHEDLPRVYSNSGEDLVAGSMAIDAIKLPAARSPPPSPLLSCRRHPYVIFFPNSHKHVRAGTARERGRGRAGNAATEGEGISGKSGRHRGAGGRGSGNNVLRAIIYPSCRPSDQSCRHMLK